MPNNDLVTDNINLVYYIVNRDYPTYVGDDDIVQCGMLGLCKAAKKWNREGNFTTYACSCIRNEIRSEFRKRKKHKGVLSLDYETNDEEGDEIAFGDKCVGSEDVAYVDVDGVYERLTSVERKIFSLLQNGLTADEIASELGCDRQIVWKTIRQIQRVWRYTNG